MLALRRLDGREDSERPVVVVERQPGERGSLSGRERGLRVGAEQSVPDLTPALPAGSRIGVGADVGIELEDPPLPVEQGQLVHAVQSG